MVDGTTIKDVDLLFHGSPCQSFSIGKKEEIKTVEQNHL
ncbi:DNA cytosine methyltransferase [Staphylococcus pseudintermedius]